MIVLVEPDRRQKNYKILSAWRTNIEREKFEEVSTEGITCDISISGGGDE